MFRNLKIWMLILSVYTNDNTSVDVGVFCAPISRSICGHLCGPYGQNIQGNKPRNVCLHSAYTINYVHTWKGGGYISLCVI